MTENKQLNKQQLEKVAGGIKQHGEINTYDLHDIISIGANTTVRIFKGSYSSNDFHYLCEGVVAAQAFDLNTFYGYIEVKGNDGVEYKFFTDGKCFVNSVVSDYWFGPYHTLI